MYAVKSMRGPVQRVGRPLLERLRMQSDGQLLAAGYDPRSITVVCLQADADEERGRVLRFIEDHGD